MCGFRSGDRRQAWRAAPGRARHRGSTAIGGATAPPFINDCGYDQAGAILRHLLAGAAARVPAGRSAAGFRPSRILAGTPRAAWTTSASPTCRRAARLGAGYLNWADTYRLVVLFPQLSDVPFSNPKRCWDFFAYHDSDHAAREGRQWRRRSACSTGCDARRPAGSVQASPAARRRSSPWSRQAGRIPFALGQQRRRIAVRDAGERAGARDAPAHRAASPPEPAPSPAGGQASHAVTWPSRPGPPCRRAAIALRRRPPARGTLRPGSRR
ncbi:MAG: hypothetical protein AVDCRST_MAG08-2609 [uncultured Acetobacteraceae bacterium]|uniref:Uncharacterized protein n=1 Tax=uncultured Acetobacteraceae bacterium TaxID=169975 RepID=A0A6J4ISE5_9PROT|nr:MAG: hypothetical protein AVDCRST_MAG08-2609 [uncultured Acetobacteraceae bacterium]